MFAITAKVADIETTEGNYKNILIAEKHKRRLEKRYPGTKFEIERVNKRETALNDYYPIEKFFHGSREIEK